MHIATATLAALTLRSTAVGLLTTLALGLALPLLGAILSAAVLGIPLLLLLVLLLAGYAYALAVVAQLASTRLRTSGRGPAARPGPTVGVVAALVLLLALVTIVAPVGGLVLLGALASPAWAPVILSRGKILPLGCAGGLRPFRWRGLRAYPSPVPIRLAGLGLEALQCGSKAAALER